ncbi:hypothetical protein Cgig2_031641 [Carnegiea gigantea]|uniref:Uncharacterized protein n=1 Tax=Carnegiea gigantea TaxID=171969 RepID=A0A9Q1QEK5_9CARY|nr:hypothetical protein Cgig2_031641 [Carnegiea gigantea]
MPNFERLAKSTMTLMMYATHSHRTAWFKELEQTLKPRQDKKHRGGFLSGRCPYGLQRHPRAANLHKYWQVTRRPTDDPRMLPCQHPATRGMIGSARTRRVPLEQKVEDFISFPTEALLIHMVASAERDRPHPQGIGGMEEIPLDEGRPDRTV